MAKKKNVKKGAQEGGRKKISRTSRAMPTFGKKRMSLYYPKPDDMRGKVRMEPPKIPPHIEPINVSLSSEQGLSTAKKKTTPYVATAIGIAGLLSAALMLVLIYIGLDAITAAMPALLFFIGLSILFFEFLALAERTK